MPQQSMYDRGFQSQMVSRVNKRPLAFNYPTLDKFSEQDEAEFLRGWNDARRQGDLFAEQSNLEFDD